MNVLNDFSQLLTNQKIELALVNFTTFSGL